MHERVEQNHVEQDVFDKTIHQLKFLDAELNGCINVVSDKLGASQVKFIDYERVWNLCENQMFDQLLLNDFLIRRTKFDLNSFDERVNLWLVVIITISGVVLSGIQLIMSYKIALSAKKEMVGDNAMIIEQGKLSLKSSVTGLFIMAFSLIFFIVYVKWIYQNIDVVTYKPENLRSLPRGELIPGGALGSKLQVLPSDGPSSSSTNTK